MLTPIAIEDKEQALAINANKKPLVLNEREYVFEKMSFQKASAMTSYVAKVYVELDKGSLFFLDDSEFNNRFLPWILAKVTYNGMQLSKLTTHFEEHTIDYIPFLVNAMSIFVAPFLHGIA